MQQGPRYPDTSFKLWSTGWPPWRHRGSFLGHDKAPKSHRRHCLTAFTDWVGLLLASKLILHNQRSAYFNVFTSHHSREFHLFLYSPVLAERHWGAQTGHIGTKMTAVSSPLTQRTMLTAIHWMMLQRFCSRISHTVNLLKTRTRGKELHALVGFIYRVPYWNNSLFWPVCVPSL